MALHLFLPDGSLNIFPRCGRYAAAWNHSPFRLAKHFHSFPESHISLNLLWISVMVRMVFPERASMQTDIFLYNQCRPLPHSPV